MSTLQNRITQLSPAKLALLSQRLKEKNGVESEVQSIPRRDSSKPAPLSYAQQRLWLLDQLDPGDSAYNIRETTRRRGRLDISVLLATLNEVVRRHESLRTTFDTINGSAVQVVAPAQTIALPIIDLSALPEPKKEAGKLAVADGSRPFDLKRGPLFRATVLKLAEEDHLIVLTMHHIIFDGWSLGVLRKEVATLYRAFSQGLPSPLPELPVQYTDYAAWQREWLQGEVLEQQFGYWKRQLEGAPEFLELPTDRPRQAVVTHRGARVGMVLSQELTAKLHELCRAEDATTFMLLLAVFKVLLMRYTGQEDIIVGTPIAGRNRVETEGLIGFFLNSLVLRTDLSGNPSARELIRRVREVALGAYAHQEFPFEKLIDELRVGRSLSHTPLFQVMFNMFNFPGGEIDLRESESSDDMRSKLDLTLYVNDQDDGIQFTLDYNTDLFNRERIVEMLDQFEHLLAQVSEDPSIEITRLSLVTPGSAKLLPEPAQPIQPDCGP